MESHDGSNLLHDGPEDDTPLDVSNDVSQEAQFYDWTEPGQWMHQVRPVPPDRLPHSAAPMVFEGFVPESASSFPEPDSGPAFRWPGVKAPPNQLPSQRPTFNQQYGQTSESEDDDDMSLDEAEIESPPGPARPRRRGRPSKGSKKPTTSQQRSSSPKGKKRPRKRGGNKGTRQAVEPDEDFKMYHGQATTAFLDERDLDKATELILKAIGNNPEIYSAHVLLSEIHFARGDDEKAIATLFSGAHASPNDPAIWHQLADICLQRSIGDSTNALQQASYCFSRVLGIDRDDCDARYQKASISKELGYHAKALKDAQVLLTKWPHNSDVLRLIAEVCLHVGDVTRAKSLYEEALEAQQSETPPVEDAFTWADLIVYTDLVSHAEGASEAIMILKRVGRWLTGRGNEGFWDDVIDNDCEWDAEHEPRRTGIPFFRRGIFPIESYGIALPLELRVKLGDLRLTEGKRTEAFDHYEWLEPEARQEGAPVYDYPDLFLQVADSLRAMKEFKHAYRYYSALNDIKAYDDLDFWLGIGACANHGGFKDDALRFYENAYAADSLNAEAHTKLAKLYAERRIRGKAIFHGKEALELYKRAIPRTARRKYERKDIREAREEAQSAYKAAYMLTPPPGEQKKDPIPSFSRRAREKARRREREEEEQELEAQQLYNDPDNEDSDFIPSDRIIRPLRAPRKRSAKSLRTQQQQEENVREVYAALRARASAMRDGDEEARSLWIDHAEALLEEFRSQRTLYPSERYKTFQGYEPGYSTRGSRDTIDPALAGEMSDVIQSVESSIPTDFCGIPFSTWLDVFLEYALLLANLQYEPAEVYNVINAAQGCAVWYHDSAAMVQIYLCYLVCTLTLEDDATLFNTVLRWFMREFSFCSDAYTLFSVINFYYPHVPDKAGKSGQMTKGQFRIPPMQKFLFRHLLHHDAQLPSDYGKGTPYGPVPEFMRKQRSEIRAGINPQTSQARKNFETADGRHQQSSRTVPPQEMDAALLNLYGQIVYAGGSFPSALSYFYRAMSLDPQSPGLLLTVSLCYFNELFKRTNENRHMYFLQGWAIFEEYASARLAQAKEKQDLGEAPQGFVDVAKREIEFNRARCFQMNGLADLALRTYERVLDSGSIKTEETEGGRMDMDVDVEMNGIAHPGPTFRQEYSMEAAYSMAIMYATNGDADTARSITEKWLVVE